MTPKQRPKEERINQIIDVALDCFTRNGYVNTTIDDIAEGCQLSKGSIYWYFQNQRRHSHSDHSTVHPTI